MSLKNELIGNSVKGFVRDKIGEIIRLGIDKQNKLKPLNPTIANTFIERAIPWASSKGDARINVSYDKTTINPSSSNRLYQNGEMVFHIDVVIDKSNHENLSGGIDRGDELAAKELAELTNIVYMIVMAAENDTLGLPVRIDGVPAAVVTDRQITSEQVFQPENDSSVTHVIGARLSLSVTACLNPPDVDGVPLLEILAKFNRAGVGEIGEVLITYDED
ncbi:hypothetical protein IHC93_19905 [Photobacterium damselae subsp. damselae]|uniref:hypothetical protein n=1 Tax=Photobacterium damselae TaxID=38293 RepID=UPI001F28056C|nr:hypothetical protein [Photobacterium damselae]UKA27190.1 hypothetical protein IHC93_19905 [Photobacterium damselae subsp. damselae]